MMILGLILALLGWFLHIQIMLIVGIILLVVGAILWVVPIGGQHRRFY
jgi:hypothetical protein